MTILADFLRDNYGQVVRIYPDSNGELIITTPTQLDDDWAEESYTIPTEGYEYRTLADSAGNTWYAYVTRIETEESIDHEIVISSTAPTSQPDGIWREPKYGVSATETQSDTTSEIYLALNDLSGIGWYVYPNSSGELVITQQTPLAPVIPPLSDTVTILSVIYNSTFHTLYVSASSTVAGVTITAAYTIAGVTTNLSGNLSYNSTLNYYKRTFTGVMSKPDSVTVTSSGGGSNTMVIP